MPVTKIVLKMKTITKLAVVGLIVFTFADERDLFHWSSALGTTDDTTVIAYQSHEATFRWKYDIGEADPISLKISCGYIPRGKSEKDIVPLVRKAGHRSRQQVVGSLPNTEIKVYEERTKEGSVDPNTVGFILTLAQFNHPRLYLCHAVSMFHNKTQSMFSDRRKLIVLKLTNL